MTMLRITALALAIAALPALAGCNRPDDADKAAAQAKARETGGLIASAIDRELEKARKELHEGNITLDGEGPGITVNGREYGSERNGSNLPKAEITPQGDLLIEGRPVSIDDRQRALLLDYRGQVIAIADAGIAIGGKGVDLAGDALQHAVGAIFTGNTGELEKQVEAQADKLKAEAMVLCKQLPPMLETQQQLAASLPEFRPYATMTREDIDDCLKDLEKEQQRASST